MAIHYGNSTSQSGLVSDLWRYTASHQGNTVLLGSNWERADTHSPGIVGGISNSSGTFSFPETGIYYISFTAHMYIHNTTNKSQRGSANIRVTTDDSNYGHAAASDCNWGGGGYSTSLNTTNFASCEVLLDVTETTNTKVRFEFGAGQGFEYVGGWSNGNNTYAYFQKVGDT